MLQFYDLFDVFILFFLSLNFVEGFALHSICVKSVFSMRFDFFFLYLVKDRWVAADCRVRRFSQVLKVRSASSVMLRGREREPTCIISTYCLDIQFYATVGF